MAFRTDKIIFYHIPKTGGRWVKEAMRYSGMTYIRTKNYYGTYPILSAEYTHDRRLELIREHNTPASELDEDKLNLFSFTFVRKPLAWYKSFWAHRVKVDGIEGRKGRFNSFPLDWIWNSNFEKFIANILRKYPNGFLTEVFQCYVGKDGNSLDFVGRQENLREDLITALSLAGEKFDKNKIRRLKRCNVSSGDEYFVKNNLLNISKGLVQELEEKEKWIIDTFYKDYEFAQ